MPEASSSKRVARQPLPENGAKILKEFWKINPRPSRQEKEELLRQVQAKEGCEWYTMIKLTTWFANHKKTLKPINTTAPDSDTPGASTSAVGAVSESPVTPSISSVPPTPVTQQGFTYQAFPLTANQISKLKDLSDTVAWPPPQKTVNAWAKVIEADLKDVTNWVSQQQQEQQQQQVGTSILNPSGHLPTPSESTSPEPWIGTGTRGMKHEHQSPTISHFASASTSISAAGKRPRPAPEFAGERVGPPAKRRVGSSASTSTSNAAKAAAAKKAANVKGKAKAPPPAQTPAELQASMSKFRLASSIASRRASVANSTQQADEYPTSQTLPPTYMALAPPRQERDIYATSSSSSSGSGTTDSESSANVPPRHTGRSQDPILQEHEATANTDTPMETDPDPDPNAAARAYADSLMSTIAQGLQSVSRNPLFTVNPPTNEEEFVMKYELFEESMAEVWKRWGPPPGGGTGGGGGEAL